MELIVKSTNDATPIWDHFLLKGETSVSINYRDDHTNSIVSDILFRDGRQYRRELRDHIVTFELKITSFFSYNGIRYPLLKIIQLFNTVKEDNRLTRIVPVHWQKISLEQTTGFTKVMPPLHPLLRLNEGVVTVAIEFVDITRLFNDVHGNTPWFMAIELLRGTERNIRVLASLRGHPFIWYVIIPKTVAAEKDLQPNLLYYPLDYGGISYPSNSINGITSPNHDTTVYITIRNTRNLIQCGANTLFSFLNKPISDEEYDAKLQKYLALTKRFEKRNGVNPPPLHHFREILTYEPVAGILQPLYWDPPFGFEQAISVRKQILLVPQFGDGGTAIRTGLKNLVESALMLIYSQGNILNHDTVSVNKLILTCYSESGGKVFTACKKNLEDIKAIVCFEPQYMNRHLGKEDTTLEIGKGVIPLLLKQRGKVIIIGRRKGKEWKDKYLPAEVDSTDLILLPDDAHYSILDYPDASKLYNPDASPVLRLRYSRLLKSSDDPVIEEILSKEMGVVDFASAQKEGKVEEIVANYRKANFSDEKMIKTVFTPEYNFDRSGGYYTHNFIISCGQELAPEGKSVLKFFQQALTLIN